MIIWFILVSLYFHILDFSRKQERYITNTVILPGYICCMARPGSTLHMGSLTVRRNAYTVRVVQARIMLLLN